MTRELVEAAKAVMADRKHLGAMFEWEGNDVLTSPNAVRWQAFVAAVRAEEAALVADTVAVPVATLRRWRSTIAFGPTFGDLVELRAAIDALLPPPPAPEPSAELVEQWHEEARKDPEYIRLGSHGFVGAMVHFVSGYVGRARAEWAKKGGG